MTLNSIRTANWASGVWQRRTDSNRSSEGQSLFRSLISTHPVGSGGEIRTLTHGLRIRSVPCTHRDWLAPRSGIEPNTTRFGISSMPSIRGSVRAPIARALVPTNGNDPLSPRLQLGANPSQLHRRCHRPSLQDWLPYTVRHSRIRGITSPGR